VPLARITGFLDRIGIPVNAAELGAEAGFLPGILVDRGGLLYDESQLTYPGDLLHEAGHIAMTPAESRASLSGSIDVPGLDLAALEIAAVPWSYAAALACEIDPVLVFHDGGYGGRSPGLLGNFAIGVPPGVHMLVEAGMTTPSTYPRMLRWLL
jgi:hypothetical protein